MYAWVSVAVKRIAVLWCDFFKLLFPSVTWIKHEQFRRERMRERARGDVSWGWLRKAVLLSSSCCSFFTHTAGIYVTAVCSHSFSLGLPPTPILISIYACECINFTPLHTHTNSDIKSTFVPVWGLTRLQSAFFWECLRVEKSKISFESWKPMRVWGLTGSREVTA